MPPPPPLAEPWYLVAAANNGTEHRARTTSPRVATAAPYQAQLGSPTLHADAAETMLCAWLSAILLGGLVLNAAVGWWWADPVAAIGIAGLAAKEGLEAWRGEPCDDDDGDEPEREGRTNP
jgi:hypothetical protein